MLNSSSHLLRKTYYGGGTVSVSLSSQRFHVLRPALADRFVLSNFILTPCLCHLLVTFANSLDPDQA